MSECRRSTESFETEENGRINRKILNGYWIWWCYEHNQPISWCIENTLKQQRDDLRDNLQAIIDDATEQVEEGMVSFKQTSVLIKLKLITNAKTAIAKLEA